MKPIKLTINAFGPYADKTEIDFTKLGDNGIYLITGDTGAGKTSIFDALSFALFGAASGETRKKNSKALRSDFAKDGNITYVELEFLSHDDKYFIRRECAYETLNKKGNPKLVSENAILTKPNKEIISVVKDVNAEITNILGIDKNQFSQIVMIAQGEFRKFLNAATPEKQVIFRKIFKTYLYETFQNSINEKYRTENIAKAKKQTALETDIANINAENNEHLSAIKETKNVYNLEELLSVLEESINSDNKEIKTFESLGKKQEEEISALDKEIQKAETVIKDKNELEKLQNEMPQLQQQQTEANKKYDEEKAKENEKQELNNLISKINNDLRAYQELEDCNINLNEKNKIKISILEEIASIEKNKTDKENTNAKNKIELEQLKDTDVQLVQINNDIEKQSDDLEKYQDFLKKINDYNDKQNEKNEKQEITKKLKEKYEEKDKIAKDYYIQFINSQSGFIAKSLIDGEKCPVCGSIHHPEPAKLSDESITQEEFEKAKQNADNAQKKSIDAANEYNAIAKIIEEREKELIQIAEKVFHQNIIAGMEEKCEDLIAAINKVNEKLIKEKAEKEKQQKRKIQIEKDIDSFEKEKTELEKTLNLKKDEKSKLEQDIASLEASIAEKRKNLTYSAKNEAESVLSESKEKFLNMQKALEKAEKEKNEIQTRIANTQGQIKALSEKVKNSDDFDIEKLKNDRNEKQNKLDEQRTINQKINNRYATNKNMFDKITKSKKEFESISERVAMLDNLSRTANGTLTGGKTKMSFETYILTTYFDEIIRAANARFKKITSNQFELRRNEQKGGGVQIGLDLDVFDTYTNKTRDVSTLSGGESFKAALALSLGLSDIVQQQAGGIQIDTMFIDEGFGSLDQESLNQTMKILTEISDNRTLIGIISHVPILKENIEKQIHVTKTSSGSKLDIKLM